MSDRLGSITMKKLQAWARLCQSIGEDLEAHEACLVFLPSECAMNTRCRISCSFDGSNPIKMSPSFRQIVTPTGSKSSNIFRFCSRR